MASGDVIVKVADKETLDRTYANTNAILAAVGEDVRVKGVKRYGLKINKNDSNPATRCTYLFDAVGMTPAAMNYSTGAFDFGDWGDVFFVKNNYPAMVRYDLQSGRLRDVISSMLHVSKTKIAQIEAINNNLIPEWKEELKKERLTFSAAYELSGMTEDEQRETLGKFSETGELTHKEVKDMKEAKAAGQQVSESDTAENGVNHPEARAGDDYETPHPEGITSLCYSCTEYETCNVKTGTCTSCDQYKNRAEAYKTDEQRYSEEQDAIDRETKKKLREMEQEEKMQKLPSDTQETGQKVHQIRLAKSYFDDVANGIKTFELRKNDRGYKKGDILEMMEFADGKNTGRMVKVLVTYILEDYTGIEDGYCIMATKLMKDGEA